MTPNVLLIVLDTARADAFEPYGAKAGTTPAFASLAARGFSHERLYSSACWTVPSHAAMFTGLLPRAVGLVNAPGGKPHGCRPVMEAHRDRLLPEVLRRLGYRTSAVSTNLWITPQSGFATGFDDFVTVDTRRQARLSRRRPRERAAWLLEGVRARADDGAAEAAETLRGWIGESPQQPFFWFVNLVEAHSPYLPPKPYNDLGPIDRARAADEATRHLTLGEIWKACAGGFDVPDGALARMRHLYACAIRRLDDWLADLLEAMDAEGLLEDTLVIVTSDHGENLGENGLMGHAYSLDERLIRVPCAVAGPGSERIVEVSSLASLPAAIAHAVDLGEHPWVEASPEGIGVAQLNAPAGPDDPRMHEALEVWGLGEEALARITTDMTCASDGSYKLIRRQQKGSNEVAEEALDLRSDPLESHPMSVDVAPDPGAVERLRGALEASESEVSSEPAVDAGGDEISADEREALEKRMRLLGYL
jgi:arylsulfatase A-like enzyme